MSAVDTRLREPQPVAALDVPRHHQCGRMPGWACVHTHPQAELWAQANLQRIGYRTFLPRYAAIRRDPVVRSLTRTVLRPLFPCYCFVHHDPADPWTPIRYAPGVASVLMNGSGLQYARAGAVEALEATEAERAVIHQKAATLAPGTPVGVRNGILAGHAAVVLSVRRSTAHIGVMMLGALREVTLPLGCLSPREA